MTEAIVCRLLRRTPAALLLVAVVLGTGCDRSIVDPALANGDDAALLRAAGVRADGRHTLGALVLEAADEVRRERGVAAAGELLRPVLSGQARVLEAERSGAAAQASVAREAVRAAELAIALESLGREGVARVIVGTGDDLVRMSAALDSLSADGAAADPLRAQQVTAGRHLEAARLALADSALPAALDAATLAAEQLVQLRRGMLELDRVVGLPELYRRAERALAAADGAVPDGAALLLRHAELAEAARAAVAAGDREAAHAALTAVREEELRFTLQLLGPECANGVVSSVGAALEELQATRSQEPRLRRMLAASADLHARARRALETGDAVAALDLGSYAAGLVNAYRLATSRF